MRLRTAFGRTGVGQALKKRVRRRRGAAHAPVSPPPPRRADRSGAGRERRQPSNVLLVSHCDFTGNSALHVYAIAAELHRRGLNPAIAVPRGVRTVADVGIPPFPVLSYRAVRGRRLRFPTGGGVDLIHAFTPREHVRRLTLELATASRCPYVVHLEDNEAAIVGGTAYPLRGREFLSDAAAITVVIERLLELKPDHVPGVVVWPGFDEAILSPQLSRGEARERLELRDDDVALAYTGNVHDSNADDVRELYVAVLRLREMGQRAVLVRTGWDFVPRAALPDLGTAVRKLGWVSRRHVPDILGAADVLVQPGRPSSYNDYRFPSKLPEFLASGRPVVLPRTNIGLHLRDGSEALLLDRGDADEICERVAGLADDAGLREELGARGREFALRELRWELAADAVESLYRTISE